MAQTKLARPRPRGRENLLRERFKLNEINLETGLLAHLIAALGTESAARLRLGEALNQHRAGVYGPISRADRLLNGYLLREHALRGTRHLFLSRHQIGSWFIEIITHLGDGSTHVRLVTTRDRRMARRGGTR